MGPCDTLDGVSFEVEGHPEAKVTYYSAAEIPGVEVVSDEDDAQSAAFGAAVSGQTLLYDREGRLIFSGGITAARGHAGDNAGRSARSRESGCLGQEGQVDKLSARKPEMHGGY